ncbi:MAG: TolC family protein, partial [Gillisia sp.]
MKNKILWFALLGFLSLGSVYAQETQTLTLKQAVKTALTQSDAVKISDTKSTTAANELQVTKNNQYPDVKVSGQYMHLT